MRKTMTQFIKENRTDLDAVINAAIYHHDGRGERGTIPEPPPRHNDRERREWVLNDEGLYWWAKREHVNI